MSWRRPRGARPGQLALAWVLSRGDDVVPIPGTKRRTYLEENVAAVEVVLEPADLAAVDEVFPLEQSYGDRYPDMGPIGVTTPRA